MHTHKMSSLKEKKSRLIYLCAQSLSHVRLFVTPRTVAHQSPLETILHRDSPGYNTGVGCHAFLTYFCIHIINCNFYSFVN